MSGKTGLHGTSMCVGVANRGGVMETVDNQGEMRKEKGRLKNIQQNPSAPAAGTSCKDKCT